MPVLATSGRRLAIRRHLRNARARVLAPLVLLLFTVYFYFPWLDEQPSELEWLQRTMNGPRGISFEPWSSSVPSRVRSNSSFDWSTVQLAHPDESIHPLPGGQPQRLPRIQHRFGAESPAAARIREARRDEVRDAFKRAWRSYRIFAWKKDVLLPISAGSQDQFSGWAATLVDSLDTLWIMGLRDDFDEAVAAVAEIDFGQSSNPRLNMFETTIRYLGGLLAAYDLSGRDILLAKAVELGELLYSGFNTENRMPVDFVDLNEAKKGTGLQVEDAVVSASPGSLTMEMTRLSQLTGNPKYYSAAKRVMDVFQAGQEHTGLPGMWPMMVSMAEQDVNLGQAYTLGGSADSLYEYLPKMHALMGGLEPRYRDMSKAFMETADRHLFFRPMLPGEDDVLMSGNVDVDASGPQPVDPESEHLTCFIGGLWALAGRLFDEPRYVELGAKLTRGHIYTYRAMPTGMGPERFNMAKCASRASCPWSEETWEAERAKRVEWKEHLPKGFTTAKDPRYILRPEAIESVFVLYRVTGQQEFQDAAWDMWAAVSNGTQTAWANAEVMDVTRAEGTAQKRDFMEVRPATRAPRGRRDRD